MTSFNPQGQNVEKKGEEVSTLVMATAQKWRWEVGSQDMSLRKIQEGSY